MSDIAKHVRIFAAEPSDDLVEKRTAVVKDLAERHIAKLGSVETIFKAANDLAVAVAGYGMSSQMTEQIEAAIKKQSTAFVRDGHELEMLVCGLLAPLHFMANARVGVGSPASRADILAAAIWSALSFQHSIQKPKLEDLRTELLTAGRSRALALAETARSRVRVPDFGVGVDDGMDVATFHKVLKPAIDSIVNALRTNATLDREELDLLWWVLGDWSELLEERVSTLAPESVAVAAGIEIGRRLRRFPANAHRYLALRHLSTNAELNMVELIGSLGGRRNQLASFPGIDRASASPAVFPLLFALRTGEVSGNGSEEKRTLREWSARALLETSILHVLFQDQGT
jgi:hypothetical protein